MQTTKNSEMPFMSINWHARQHMTHKFFSQESLVDGLLGAEQVGNNGQEIKSGLTEIFYVQFLYPFA